MKKFVLAIVALPMIYGSWQMTDCYIRAMAYQTMFCPGNPLHEVFINIQPTDPIEREAHREALKSDILQYRLTSLGLL
ncbi:hypothetical protein [uncultured Marivita sp.]|uniref:hypothetical protein n=1 Tax=uncultured Marivita sp. TaxID=888080 RepID=UPI0026087D47|nr:hypothetical protein [uncultured Marivita sp.]